MDNRDRVADVADLDDGGAGGLFAVEGPFNLRGAIEGKAGSPEEMERRIIIVMRPQGGQDLVQDDQVRREGDEHGLEEAVVHMNLAVFQLQDAAEGG